MLRFWRKRLCRSSPHSTPRANTSWLRRPVAQPGTPARRSPDLQRPPLGYTGRVAEPCGLNLPTQWQSSTCRMSVGIEPRVINADQKNRYILVAGANAALNARCRADESSHTCSYAIVGLLNSLPDEGLRYRLQVLRSGILVEPLVARRTELIIWGA